MMFKLFQDEEIFLLNAIGHGLFAVIGSLVYMLRPVTETILLVVLLSFYILVTLQVVLPLPQSKRYLKRIA